MNISIIFAIVTIFFIGFLFLRLLNVYKNENVLYQLAVSYGVGVGIIGYQMITYSLLHIQWTIYNFLLPYLVVGTYCIFKYKNFFYVKFFKIQFTYRQYFLFFLIVLLIIFVGFEATLRPLSAWDGFSIWLLKSNIFYFDGYINPQVLTYVESDYPLIMSLIGTYFYIFAGGIQDTHVLVLFYLFYVSLGIILYFSLQKKIGKTKSLLFTFLFLSVQSIIRQGGRFDVGYVDLPLAYYFLLSYILLVNYIKNKSNWKILVLLNSILAIITQIKNEGTPFALLVQCILCFYIIKSKKHNYLFISLIWLLPTLCWYIFKYLFQITPNFIFMQTRVHIERIPLVIGEFIKEFINYQHWNLLWITFFLVLFLYWFQKKSINSIVLLIIISFQLFVYFLIYLITPLDPVSHIANSFDRLLIHLSPLALVYIAISSTNIIIKKRVMAKFFD